MWSALLPGCFLEGEKATVPIERECVWARDAAWTFGKEAYRQSNQDFSVVQVEAVTLQPKLS